MTIFIGVVLLLAGVASLGLYPPNRVGTPLLVAGVVVLVLRATGAVAADLPAIPLPGGVAQKHSPAVQRAIANLERHRRMSQADFEKMLQSSKGKGRLE